MMQCDTAVEYHNGRGVHDRVNRAMAEVKPALTENEAHESSRPRQFVINVQPYSVAAWWQAEGGLLAE